MYRNCLLSGMILLEFGFYFRLEVVTTLYLSLELNIIMGMLILEMIHILHIYNIQLILLWVVIGTKKKHLLNIFYGEFIQHGLPIGRSAINRIFAVHIQKCDYCLYMLVTCLLVLLFFSSSQKLCFCVLIGL